ncbi:hypothetical protein Ocin01_08222 [Orchesella cincta]|uniref:Uncharacterized protein n=1 Tax=Orchesella cincta TaxID=48709 RepID=A0A1D2MZP2_ORCCI|nr:hypothetical protein Ocin01_08222 [Orchesella cincta]
MTTLTECERLVVEKLITVFSRALNCQLNDNGTTIVDSEVSTVEKILRILLSENATIANGDGGLGTIVQADNYVITNESSADVVTNYSQQLPTAGQGDTISDGRSGSINKLHKLEIIKVGVLIAVISIIMLTTCRMVFQLFIRFRPEKPPLG